MSELSTGRIRPAFSDRALIEACHQLELLTGQGVSLEDYALAAALLFSELERDGWEFSPPSDGAMRAETLARIEHDKSMPLAALIEARRHG